jgi:hypothetical protein
MDGAIVADIFEQHAAISTAGVIVIGAASFGAGVAVGFSDDELYPERLFPALPGAFLGFLAGLLICGVVEALHAIFT